MKNLSLIIAMCLLIISGGCKKDEDTNQEKEIKSKSFDIKELLSFIGKPYDEVKESLKDNLYEEKSQMGDRYFDITLKSDDNVSLSTEIKEKNKIVSEINITDWTKVSNSEYQNNQCYKYSNLITSQYNSPQDYFYSKGSKQRLFYDKDEFWNYIKEYGYIDASYLITWSVSSRQIKVFYGSNRFLLQIKSK